MRLSKTPRYLFAAALLLWCVCACRPTALAQAGQSNAPSPRPAINYDAQLYLLVASNQVSPHIEVPQAAEATIKQLRTVLPFNDYRLALTFLNRVQEGGHLDYSGIGSLSLLPPASGSPLSPTFFQFSLGEIRTTTNAAGQPAIQVASFRFGLKVPVQTAAVSGEGNKGSYPVIQYQDTGISTQLTVREDTPTVVGTLPASKPDETFVLVLTIRRAAGG